MVGALAGRGLDPSLRRQLRDAPPRRRLSVALSPDGIVAMIRSHRVVVIPNPYRDRETT